MAENSAGSIVYTVSADIEPLLVGGKLAAEALDKFDRSAQSSSKGMDNLDKSASQAGGSFSELAGYANSMDNQLKKLNTNVSGIARAMEEARTGVGGAAAEFSRAESVIEALGNQLAILEEAQENGARSAAMLAAQLRAGSAASEEEKATIGQLAGAYFDLRSSADEAAKATAAAASAARQADSSISKLESDVSLLSTEMQSGGRSAAILAAQMSAGGGATQEQSARIAELAGSLYDMREAQSAATKASADAARQLAQEANEAQRIASMTADLSNQISILNEQQTKGSRSAAILAAQLRAGSKASDEEKQKIAELTGRLYDMKSGVDTGTKSHGNWKTSMQQAGYQVQDFIVQVQGGQSALVAFSQQGAQLAGAFGPSGAVLGAIIALGSVIAGTLITSLNGGKSAMDALKDATEAMDKVITVSQTGVAALSDKYALLARTNAEAATILRNQALIEYNAAVQKIPKSINDASSSIITFTDKLRTSFSTGEASIDSFNKNLLAVGATSNDFARAMEQARGAGARFVVQSNSIQSTVKTLADKFGISEQAAFKLSKQLSDVANNPTPEALQKLVIELQNTHSASKDGAAAIVTFLGPLTELVRVAGEAQINLAGMKKEVDNLTAGQKNLIQQSERSLALSKLQGEARARLQAQYAAEDAGFAKDDSHTKKMQDDAAATYKNTQAQKELKKEQGKKTTSSSDAAASALDRQSAAIARLNTGYADGSVELAKYDAVKALGSQATQQQIAEANRNAEAEWKLQKAKEAVAQADRDKQSAQSNFTSLKGQASPVAGVDNQFQQQMEQLNQYATLYPQKIAEVEAVRASIEEQYRQKRTEAMWQEWSQQNAATQAAAAAFDAFGNQASNALTGIITGSMSASDAVASIGRTVLNDVIDTFVQMGVEQAKAAIMGGSVQQAQIAATTAAQVGGLATSTAASTASASTTMAAWLPAALVASVGSFGAAAIVGGAALVGAFALSKTLGKRKNGGPVSAGSMYQVGEGGMPEIYRASTGKQYMIPGDNGKVISNRDMQSGSGGVNVKINVVNQSSGATVQSANGYMQDGSAVVDLLLTDIESGGPFSSQMQSTFGLRRQANGAY